MNSDFDQTASSYINKIGSILFNLPVDNWEDMHFLTVVNHYPNGSKTTDVIMYAKNPMEGRYYNMLDIPEIYGIDKRTFKTDIAEIIDTVKELNHLFVENEMTPWTMLFMDIKPNGKFDINFDYTDWVDAADDESTMLYTQFFKATVLHDAETIEKYGDKVNKMVQYMADQKEKRSK